MNAEACLLDMGIRSQHVADAQFPHNSEAGQIGEQDAWFVTVAQRLSGAGRRGLAFLTRRAPCVAGSERINSAMLRRARKASWRS
ncbi:MAG TPA: hypothetical protein VNH18_18270, partial [Bryobacteraceae bacterium]|nr:hypothetical protein [Bryobacteraceae bacterium]